MTSSPQLVGAQIGSYSIESIIGSGGMAVVYRGFDTQLQRPVAVKVLSPALAADPEYERRFRREARLVAALRHPNIAHVYALGEYNGAPYMVQELLPGPTLDQRLYALEQAGQRLGREEGLAILGQLAAALDAAHAVGVIHRDVKPSNAIYNSAQQIVLTDFGIARSPDDDGEPPTQPGVIIGTPAYIAPEQALGAPLTPAADLYALAVVAYQILVGHVPFEASTPVAVLHKHLYERPRPPSQLRPELGANVDAVLLRALAKEPAARFAGAGAFVEALRVSWPGSGATRVLGSRTVRHDETLAPAPAAPAPPALAPPPAPRRWPAALLLALVLLAALVAGTVVWRQRQIVTVQQGEEAAGGEVGGAPRPTRTPGELTPGGAATTIFPDSSPVAAAGGANPGPGADTASLPASTAVSAGSGVSLPQAPAQPTFNAVGATAFPAQGSAGVIASPTDAGTRATAEPAAQAPAATERASEATAAPRTGPPASGPPTRVPAAPTGSPGGSPPAPPVAPTRTAGPVAPEAPVMPSPTEAAVSAPPAPPTRTAAAVAPAPSRTPVPATSTQPPPTRTAVPPTSTSVPSTETPVPPTSTSVPSTETPVPPTSTSVPPTETPVPPTETAPPADTSSGPVQELGELIAAGVSDGRAGSAGAELAQLHEGLVRALEAGDRKDARAALRDLSKALREGVREGGTSPDFAAAAERLLEAIGTRYDLKG